MNDLGPTSHFFQSQRLRLHYVDWGNAGAPLMLLLHGNRDHCRSWDWTARALRDVWHVVTPDLRGHGDSAWSADGRYDITSFVYDLAQLLSHLNAERVVIVAHSLGAHIALRYAGLYPDVVQKLVAVEAVGAPLAVEKEWSGLSVGGRMRRWIAERRAAAGRAPRRYSSPEDALARMEAQNRYLSREQARHLTLHGLARNEDGSWSWKFDNLLRVIPFPDIPYPDIVALWRAITCPTLLIYGTESWSSSVPDALAGELATGRVATLEQAGHWPHHDRFDTYMGELRAFLAE